MSEQRPESTAPDGSPQRDPLPVWKKAFFVLALVLGLVGVAMTRGGTTADVAPASSGGTGLVAPSSFGGTGIQLGGPSAAPTEEEPVSPWGPLFMKGGLSFAVAFAAGYALRTFLKLTLVVLGVVVLAIFGLQKAGIVGAIDWSVAQGYWDSLTANVGQQFESFKTFVTGSLPSAGAGTAGLVSGFRK
ncbi:MAG: hypothetical protein R3F49_15040 [Planctomycetota bacterium]